MAAASATFWVLKFSAAPQVPAPQTAMTNAPQSDVRVVARLLGGGQAASVAEPAAAPADSAAQYKLVGVVTDRGRNGYALIAINDQPARPYRVGAPVGDTLMLHSVAARSAALATDVLAPASVQLALPALVPAPGAEGDR